MHLSIIIPLFNEEEHITKVLDKLQIIELPDYVQKTEIIIIDDCSTDSSYETVVKYINKANNIRIYKLEQNRGKGFAVREGIAKSKGDIILIQDADLELDPFDIPVMVKAMHDLNIEFINGSRYMAGVIRPLYSFRRYSANRIFTLLTSWLINVKITDMACGYKLVHKNLLSRITLKENRFGIEAELILKALRVKKNNIAEVPVQYFPRNEGEGKKLKNTDGLKILWTIFKYGLLRLK